MTQQPNQTYIDLLEKIRSKTATIGVVGLGYVGLPLIRAFVESGFKTIGFDVDDGKVQQLLAGQSYIKHIESDWIASLIENGQFDPTSDMQRLAEPDAILVCVPTPLSPSRDPDLKYVEGTAREIAKNLRTGQLVVLESTTYPGTTRDVLCPILSESGLDIGQDFFVAYSPEREDPGNQDFSASRIPKVVGGMDAKSLELAEAMYAHAVVETIPVSTCEIAEACKILENTYRSVNIAMVNELKILFDHINIDIWETINAAKTKPFGFQAFYPGPGLGGHCIPIDPFYLSWVARLNGQSTRFIELAGEINSSMPDYVVHKVAEALNKSGKPIKNSKVGIFGVAYKRDVDDPRESPAFRLMELLNERGATLSYHDPFIPTLPKMRSFDVPALESNDLTEAYLTSLDCLLICTDHSGVDWQFVVDHSNIVVDTRNACSGTIDNDGKIYTA
ncbi:MAG: nucleotide sugar dehydrogenase [Pirellulales bacterium]|nr:nucleotide sugar dehydrogenase [Pirellulales bacterium]